MSSSPVPHQQVLIGAPITLSVQFADADGEPADGGTVTIGVTDAAGTVVVPALTATSGATDSPRTYALPTTATDALALLTATWTSSTHGVRTTLIEVVGGYWFTVAFARSRDDKLIDTGRYPTTKVLAVRAEVEHEAEDITGQAWVPRYRRTTVQGTGHSELVLPDLRIRTLRSAWVYSDGTTYQALTADEIASVECTAHGTLIRRDGAWWPLQRIVVEYEHGHDAPPPDLRDAAITRLRHRLNSHKSGIPDRATSMQTDEGQTYSLVTPGLRGFVTGIPEVDMTYSRYTRNEIGVG